jgi:hypothetical protein
MPPCAGTSDYDRIELAPRAADHRSTDVAIAQVKLDGRILDQRINRRPVLGGLINEYERAT